MLYPWHIALELQNPELQKENPRTEREKRINISFVRPPNYESYKLSQKPPNYVQNHFLRVVFALLFK